ncbi:MAG: hypothetical protein EA350_11300 [Gemmatimonadales bacterium]|nr:MAG: hypothetical protein EA350_11300 [Gemmatimonadales bacterium]
MAGASVLALGLVFGAMSFAHADPAPEPATEPGAAPFPDPTSDPTSAPTSDPAPEIDTRRPPAIEAERALVQAHLAEVEAALRAAPTDHLGSEQRANRASLLDELRAYRLAGSFPRNLEVAGRSPVFVDDTGVHCAVGHLLHRTGEDELVAAVAEARNRARIFDLLDDPALVVWLDASGLSPVEAAWIQPMYCNLEGTAGLHLGWCDPWPNPGREELSREYLALTVGTSTLGAALATVNFLDLGAGHPSAGRGLLGMGVGATGVGLGAAGILDGGDARRAGWVNVAFGLLGVGSGAWTFHRARVQEAQAPAGRPIVADVAAGPTISIRPWVPVGGAVANPEAVGLSVGIAH